MKCNKTKRLEENDEKEEVEKRENNFAIAALGNIDC